MLGAFEVMPERFFDYNTALHFVFCKTRITNLSCNFLEGVWRNSHIENPVGSYFPFGLQLFYLFSYSSIGGGCIELSILINKTLCKLIPFAFLGFSPS